MKSSQPLCFNSIKSLSRLTIAGDVTTLLLRNEREKCEFDQVAPPILVEASGSWLTRFRTYGFPENQLQPALENMKLRADDWLRIRCEKELSDRLEAIAISRRMNLSALVREILWDHVDREIQDRKSAISVLKDMQRAAGEAAATGRVAAETIRESVLRDSPQSAAVSSASPSLEEEAAGLVVGLPELDDPALVSPLSSRSVPIGEPNAGKPGPRAVGAKQSKVRPTFPKRVPGEPHSS